MVGNFYPKTYLALLKYGINPAVVPLDGLSMSGYETFNPLDRTMRTMHEWPSYEAMREVIDAYMADGREAQ